MESDPQGPIKRKSLIRFSSSAEPPTYLTDAEPRVARPAHGAGAVPSDLCEAEAKGR